jgi:hypothetical protein
MPVKDGDNIERTYEAPAVTDLGSIDTFTLGDRDSVIDEPTP